MTTKIEWADETWSPITGCDPVSPGCDHCWARRMARRLAGRFGYPEAPNHFDVTLRPERLDQPLKWKKPRRVFVCSMSDLFHPDVPFEFITQMFDVMADARCQEHMFMVLTKRPERINKWINWVCEWWPGDSPYGVTVDVFDHIPNVWLGVTAENQEQADKRIPLLLQIPAAVRFVSVEPMLDRMVLTDYFPQYDYRPTYPYWQAVHPEWGTKPLRISPSGLDWVICGAETGPGARPMKLEWARDLRDQCQEAGVPFFMKAVTGGAIPDDLMIREFPQ